MPDNINAETVAKEIFRDHQGTVARASGRDQFWHRSLVQRSTDRILEYAAQYGLGVLEPHARATDMQTSQDAAAAIEMKGRHQEVLTLLCKHGPMTDWYMVNHSAEWECHQSPSSLRSRRCELVRAGLVRAVKTIGLKGRKHTVWEALRKEVSA